MQQESGVHSYSIDIIKQKLKLALDPSLLTVIDESKKHVGHIGYSATSPSHIRIEITSAALSGMTKVKSHRIIYDLLRDELNHGLHAVSIIVYD